MFYTNYILVIKCICNHKWTVIISLLAGFPLCQGFLLIHQSDSWSIYFKMITEVWNNKIIFVYLGIVNIQSYFNKLITLFIGENSFWPILLPLVNVVGLTHSWLNCQQKNIFFINTENSHIRNLVYYHVLRPRMLTSLTDKLLDRVLGIKQSSLLFISLESCNAQPTGSVSESLILLWVCDTYTNLLEYYYDFVCIWRKKMLYFTYAEMSA